MRRVAVGAASPTLARLGDGDGGGGAGRGRAGDQGWELGEG